MKWVLLGAGLLSTSCAGAIGAGAAVVFVGAGIAAYTCYDRVSVTVTDRVTGTPLCDAKVTFVRGKSETEATSCYQAALSSGSYTLRVERAGLATFEEPVDVSESKQCGQTTQTMYVALDRRGGAQAPSQAEPAAAPVTVLPPPPPAPAGVTPPAATSPAAGSTPVATPPAAGSATTPPAAAPSAPAPSSSAAPALPPSTSFPDVP